MAWRDPIVEETRQLREEYAEHFGFDLEAICRDLRVREAAHPERLVSRRPRPTTEPVRSEKEPAA